MFLRDLLMSCLRRWYFLVLGLLITVAGTYLAYTHIAPTYEANASVVLIPPKVAVTVGDNPYLYLGGLDQALGVLQVKMASPEVSDGPTNSHADYEILISKDATTSGPIAAIKVSAPTENETMSLLGDTVAMVPKTLASLQQEQRVPKSSMITSMVLSQDLEPVEINKRQIQMTAVVLVAGASSSLLLTGLLDRLLTGRKERKASRQQAKKERKARKQESSAGSTPQRGSSEYRADGDRKPAMITEREPQDVVVQTQQPNPEVSNEKHSVSVGSSEA